MLASVATATSETTDIAVPNVGLVETESIVIDTEETAPVVVLEQLKTTKEVVEEYFKDTPVLIDVAYCESRFTQFNKDGSVLRGRANAADVGVMQINEQYHAATAVSLGYNIYSLEGNMAYAKYLYETYGTDPWVHSAKCWNSVREVAFVNE